MSRFHFSSDMANEVKKSLIGLDGLINDTGSILDELINILRENDSFGIIDIIEDICKEIKYEKHIGFMAKSGAESLSQIINSLDNTAKMAVKFTNISFNAGVTAINNVIENSKNNQSSVDKTPIHSDDIITKQYPDGVVTNEYTYEKDGMIYTPIWHWGNRVALRTDSAGGIGIFKEDGSLFETYNQNTQQFTHGEWGSQECTSTALAQCSTINGITKQANDYNLPGAYHWDGTPDGATQIGGYQASSEDITRYCVDNLKRGCATVIYYNYEGCSGFGQNGHALTVVGANANPTSVYDLNVIDPATGAYVNFGQAYNVCSNSMYICYETSPNTDGCGGAGTKIWDITQYFGH